MQQFPKLDDADFIKTRRQVHSIAKVIGRLRERLVKPIAKNDNLWLTVVEKGFCTPPMGDLKELEIGCNLESLIVEIADSTGKYRAVDINGSSAAGLCSEINTVLSGEFGMNSPADPGEFDSGKTFSLSGEAKDFLAQLTNYSDLLNSFHRSINGGIKTQVCLWPHHFDNAFKWFSGRTIGDEQEQMGIGVSNGDETYELPYVYMTLWPELRKTNTLEIPEEAVLHDYEWTGLILPYEAVMEKKTPGEQQMLVNNFLETSFKSIQRGFSKR